MRALLMLFISFMSLVAYGQDQREASIREAVERQMRTYPLSTLRDLYKNFFQDRFGPGHIVSDTTSAGNYLRSELAASERFGGAPYEPTGYRGDFYRVNLSVIKEGLVDYSTYFGAFVRSVNAIQPPSVEVWKAEWKEINAIISNMDLRLEHCEPDSLEIDHLLEEGKYVMHHSRIFGETYDPHYRIMNKEIFEKEILPLIEP